MQVGGDVEASAQEKAAGQQTGPHMLENSTEENEEEEGKEDEDEE
jgi:hypothetical protein